MEALANWVIELPMWGQLIVVLGALVPLAVVGAWGLNYAVDTLWLWLKIQFSGSNEVSS